MPAEYFALALYRGGYPVAQDNGPLLAVLDFAPHSALATRRQLNRHLAGELRREGVDEGRWGEYELRVFPVDRDGDPERNARYRWAFDLDDETGERL